jgi:DNA-binding NtrC family response regulator
MRVLLVDDDPRFVSTFGMTLEREGHLVVAKHTVADALHYLQHHLPDILIVDIDLHGAHSGWDLVRHVQRRRPNLPVVVVTGHVGSAPPEDLLAPIFLKPFDLDTLLQYLREHV